MIIGDDGTPLAPPTSPTGGGPAASGSPAGPAAVTVMPDDAAPGALVAPVAAGPGDADEPAAEPVTDKADATGPTPDAASRVVPVESASPSPIASPKAEPEGGSSAETGAELGSGEEPASIGDATAETLTPLATPPTDETAPEVTAEESSAEVTADKTGAESSAERGAELESGEEPASIGDATAETLTPAAGTADETAAEVIAEAAAMSTAGETAAEVTAAEPVPATRRERRLAEQTPQPGVVPVRNSPVRDSPVRDGKKLPARPAPKTVRATEGTPVGRARRGGKLQKFFPSLRGFLFFLVIAAIVVGMGTVISGQSAADLGPSRTEAARQAALAQTRVLLAESAALGSTPGAGANAALLKSAAAALQVHIKALGDGLAHPSPEPSATVKPGLTTAAFAGELAANAGRLLDEAVVADAAMGRVFASVGASQLLHAQTLGRENGKFLPASPFLTPLEDQGAGAGADPAQPTVGPQCKSTLAPQPGVSADAALIAAARGEQKAVYAYQVAATRLPEPEFSTASALLVLHQNRLKALNAALATKCLPRVTIVPGFALDSAFTASPSSALARLEDQLGRGYGDLAALSSPSPTPVPGLAGPGNASTPATPAPAPVVSPELRRLAVKFLAESARNEQLWDGRVGALPGYPAAVAAPAGAAAR